MKNKLQDHVNRIAGATRRKAMSGEQIRRDAAVKAAVEEMRKACIQKVRDAYHAGTISEDAYEWVAGTMRNIVL